MEKRFSLSSLKGMLQVSYLSICVVLAITLLIVVWRGNSLYKEREDLYALRSLKYHSSELRNSLNYSFMLLQLYAQYDTILHAEDMYYQTAIDVFYDDALVNFDSVQRIANGNIEIVLDIKKTINELETKYNHLRKKTEKGDPLRNYIRLDMLGLVMRLNKNIDKLIIDEKNQETVELTTLNERIIKNNYLAIPLFVFVIAVTYFLGRRALVKVIEGLKDIHHYLRALAQGQIPDSVRIPQNEFGRSLKHIQTISKGLEELKEFAQDVGNQNFSKEISVFPKDSQLGTALDKMKEQLAQVAQNEQERHWENEGAAKLAQVIRKQTENTQILCDQFLFHLIEYTQTQQGAIFLPTEGGKKLVLRSAYAYGRKKFVHQEILSDEGILGEVFQDGKTIYMNDIPEDYAQINTGLGAAKPTCVLVVPLVSQEKVMGVLEIAAFGELSKVKIRLIERTAEILAASISSVANAEQMRKLLDESKQITQQMGAQEEELRQNTEELMATREELEKQLAEAQAQAAEKDHIFEDSNQGFVFVDASGRILRVNYAFTSLLGYSKDELVGQTISKFIPDLKGLNRHAQRDSEQLIFHQYEGKTRTKKDIQLWANVTKLEITKQMIFMIAIASAPNTSATKSEINQPLANS